MKKIFTVLGILLFFSTASFGEYRMQSVQCTLKKQSNCGAYLYNSTTGAAYYCDSEKCKQVMEVLEETAVVEEEVSKTTKKKKKSKIPKMKKKRKRNQKYLSLKRKNQSSNFL